MTSSTKPLDFISMYIMCFNLDHSKINLGFCLPSHENPTQRKFRGMLRVLFANGRKNLYIISGFKIIEWRHRENYQLIHENDFRDRVLINS